MSPEQIRATDVQCLAQRAIDALGVNIDEPTAAEIMEHAIGQACIELEAVEKVLEREQGEIGMLVYLVAGVRQRLTMAQHSSEFLATVLAEGNEMDQKAADTAEPKTSQNDSGVVRNES